MKKLILFGWCMFLFGLTNAQSKLVGDDIGIPAIADQLTSPSNQNAFITANKARWCEIYDPWKDKCVKWEDDKVRSPKQQREEAQGRTKAMNRFVQLVAGGKTRLPANWGKQAMKKFPGELLTDANDRFDFITKKMESVDDDE